MLQALEEAELDTIDKMPKASDASEDYIKTEDGGVVRIDEQHEQWRGCSRPFRCLLFKRPSLQDWASRIQHFLYSRYKIAILRINRIGSENPRLLDLNQKL